MARTTEKGGKGLVEGKRPRHPGKSEEVGAEPGTAMGNVHEKH